MKTRTVIVFAAACTLAAGMTALSEPTEGQENRPQERREAMRRMRFDREPAMRPGSMEPRLPSIEALRDMGLTPEEIRMARQIVGKIARYRAAQHLQKDRPRSKMRREQARNENSEFRKHHRMQSESPRRGEFRPWEKGHPQGDAWRNMRPQGGPQSPFHGQHPRMQKQHDNCVGMCPNCGRARGRVSDGMNR